jgi:hypothetical protein
VCYKASARKRSRRRCGIEAQLFSSDVALSVFRILYHRFRRGHGELGVYVRDCASIVSQRRKVRDEGSTSETHREVYRDS